MTEATMRSLNAAFRFVLEMLLLVAVLLFGLGASGRLIIALPVAAALVAVIIAIWGLFVAPKATYRLDDPARLGVELGVWLVGAIAIVFVANWVVAVLFALAVIVSLVLMFALGQRGI